MTHPSDTRIVQHIHHTGYEYIPDNQYWVVFYQDHGYLAVQEAAYWHHTASFRRTDWALLFLVIKADGPLTARHSYSCR